MTIILKNKDTLIFDDFKFRCCVGKMGITNNKIEGDKKTPSGLLSLGKVFYRKDRNSKPITKLNLISIKKTMVWCNDIKSKYYNILSKQLDINPDWDEDIILNLFDYFAQQFEWTPPILPKITNRIDGTKDKTELTKIKDKGMLSN